MKNILILGANSDMGIALARLYASQKFNVMLASRGVSQLQAIKNDLQIRYNTQVSAFEFDACKYESHKKFFEELTYRPDITICFFGYLGDQKIAESNWEEAQRIINTNFTGAVSILNIIANAYELQQSGVIVGVSSVAGDRGRQSNYIYGSAKAGFTAYLSGLRNRLFHANVHVMTVKPGFVNTKMTDGLKLPKPITAQPDQVAKSIIHGINKKKNIIYVLWMWRWIMVIITLIPEFIFKKLKM
ncbi:MAG TPA: SDR family oxidoreductase [Cytophagales bacterium]|nr:SDR family oxidoreductase [Cytophagales bacterium]